MQAGKNKSFTFTLGLEIDTMKAGQPYQSPRQRVWAAIRKNSNEFTIEQVAELGQMKYESARGFVASLVKAKVVQILREAKVYGHSKSIRRKYFMLVNDLGYTVPSISKDGKLIASVTGNKAMWNTLRITKQAVNAHELVQLASNDEISIKLETANEYLRALHHAGYLTLTQPANNAGGKAKYKLLPGMDTGPNSPQIQRAKQVFDPNTNQVMFTERPELEEEIKHGTLLHDQREEINDEY
ncbi:MAG: hypothetical protein RSD94_11155 [Acinetobacter sp.]